MDTGRDAHYTPPWIAELLAAIPRTRRVERILDLACGDGSLLAAAAGRFPRADVYGVDISQRAIACAKQRSLKRSHLYCANSLGPLTVVRSQIGAFGVDIALLNPPFSARQSKSRHALLPGIGACSGSTAALIFLTAVGLLRPGGCIVAIMPGSFARTHRDGDIRRKIAELGSMEVLSRLPSHCFPGVVASTIIVQFIKRRVGTQRRHVSSPIVAASPPASLRRYVVKGNTQVHTLGIQSTFTGRFAHTTELRGCRLESRIESVGSRARSVVGPVVLIPRVGHGAAAKITAHCSKGRLYLSDCVVAVGASSLKDAQLLADALRLSWRTLFPLYEESTGAPYLTMPEIEHAIAELSLGGATELAHSLRRGTGR